MIPPDNKDVKIAASALVRLADDLERVRQDIEVYMERLVAASGKPHGRISRYRYMVVNEIRRSGKTIATLTPEDIFAE